MRSKELLSEHEYFLLQNVSEVGAVFREDLFAKQKFDWDRLSYTRYNICLCAKYLGKVIDDIRGEREEKEEVKVKEVKVKEEKVKEVKVKEEKVKEEKEKEVKEVKEKIIDNFPCTICQEEMFCIAIPCIYLP